MYLDSEFPCIMPSLFLKDTSRAVSLSLQRSFPSFQWLLSSNLWRGKPSVLRVFINMLIYCLHKIHRGKELHDEMTTFIVEGVFPLLELSRQLHP